MKNEVKITAAPGVQEMFITREFEAPRELVFEAFTDPDLLVQWLGPRRLVMKIDYMECKNHGSYRYIHADDKGNEYGFNGVIHEVAVPERIIQTFEFEGLPEKGHVCLSTARFESLPGNRTRMTIQDVYQSVTDRDMAIASGMESGIVDSYNRLDELIEKGI